MRIGDLKGRKTDTGYMAYFYVTDDTGQRRQKAKRYKGMGVRAAKEAAREWYEAACAELTAEADDNRAKSITDYITAYIDAAERAQTIEGATIKSYRQSVKLMQTRLASTPIPELTAQDIMDWEGSLIDAGYSAVTVKRAHTLLKGQLRRAVADGHIERNPMEITKPPKTARRQPTYMDGETTTELLRLLSKRPEGDIIKTIGYLGLYTGMRVGEMCGLRWDDVGEDIITVRHAIGITSTGREYVKTTKTDRVRRVPIAADLREVLDGQRRFDARQCLATRASINDCYVLGGPTETFCRKTRACKVWGEYVRANGIMCVDGTYATIHKLRHTFATRAVASHMDIETLASILGHADVSVTLNTYASADERAVASSADLIGQMMHADPSTALRFIA